VSMTNPPNRIEIITSVERRRRSTASEKVRMVEETFEPDMMVSLVGFTAQLREDTRYRNLANAREQGTKEIFYAIHCSGFSLACSND
jgi:transposase-like protein